MWRVWLDGALTAGLPSEAILDAREQAAAARLRNAGDRARYVTAHVALRDILARYAAVPAAALRFDRSARGHPVVASPVEAAPLHFSLSRSSGLALVGIARGRLIGVDVERCRPGVDVESVSRQFFPADERAALAAVAPAARRDAIYRHWTRREAALKARGLGLPDGIGRDGRFMPIHQAGVELIDLLPASGFLGALAVEPPLPAVTLVSWETRI